MSETIDKDTVDYLKEISSKVSSASDAEESAAMVHSVLDEIGDRWLAVR